MKTPHGVFRGVNMMTPRVLSHHKLSRGGWAELSTGRGLTGEPVYGVTVRRHDGGRFEPDPSKLLFALADALSYIAQLSK